MEKRQEGWKFDKHIPLAVLFALVVQTISLVWYLASWKADHTARIGVLEKWATQNEKVIERVSRVEATVDAVRQQTGRIEDKLDNLVRVP